VARDRCHQACHQPIAASLQHKSARQDQKPFENYNNNGAHEPLYFGPQFFVSLGSAKNASAAVSGLYITHAILTAHYNAVTLMAARAIKLPAQVSIFCYSFMVSTILLGVASVTNEMQCLPS